MNNFGYCKVGIFYSLVEQNSLPKKAGASPQMNNPYMKSPGYIENAKVSIFPTKAKSNAVVLDLSNAPDFRRKA